MCLLHTYICFPHPCSVLLTTHRNTTPPRCTSIPLRMARCVSIDGVVITGLTGGISRLTRCSPLWRTSLTPPTSDLKSGSTYLTRPLLNGNAVSGGPVMSYWRIGGRDTPGLSSRDPPWRNAPFDAPYRERLFWCLELHSALLRYALACPCFARK